MIVPLMPTKLALAALLLASTACVGDPTPAKPRAARAELPAVAGGPEFVPAPEGAVQDVVRTAMDAAKVDGRTLIVYVGASWCEPCQRFHDAVERGELDGRLANLRLLEFDADRDRQRLLDAGYGSRLVPLFAVPGADGRASDARIEGGVKGDRAVDHIVGRLEPLLEPAKSNG